MRERERERNRDGKMRKRKRERQGWERKIERKTIAGEKEREKDS